MGHKNNFAKDGLKLCTGCKSVKPVNEFGKQTSRKDGLDYRCKICMKAYLAERYKNPEVRMKIRSTNSKWREENPDSETNNYLLRKYGITLDDYKQMFAEQKGVCAICSEPERTRRRKKLPENERLAVDHCHETGVVRGLLCFKCNTAIGSLGDTQETVMKVIYYLSKSLVDEAGNTFRLGLSNIK